MQYDEYMRSEAWEINSKAAIERAGNKCQLCSSVRRLCVHHNTYERVGAELPTDLCVLCNRCHERFHVIIHGKPTVMPQRPVRVKKSKKQLKREAKLRSKRAELDHETQLEELRQHAMAEQFRPLLVGE